MATGRRSPIEDEKVVEALIKAAGFPLKMREIAAAGGIANRTLRDWLKQGRDDQQAGEDTVHSRFLARFEVARSKTIARAYDAVEKSFLETTEEIHETINQDGTKTTKTIIRPPDAKAAMWWLNRAHIPQRELELPHDAQNKDSEVEAKSEEQFNNYVKDMEQDPETGAFIVAGEETEQ